jgi:hypothetical protein
LAGSQNGQLLALAVRELEVLVTIDRRMKYQQNFQKLPIGIVVIDTRDTRFESIHAHVEELREAIARVKPGEMISVPEPPNSLQQAARDCWLAPSARPYRWGQTFGR